LRKPVNGEKNESRRMLFPVRLVSVEKLQDWECFDADLGKDAAKEVREYFVPDFSEWKHHDSYTNALADLLRDLQANQRPISAVEP
jgi:hypothetical protein